LVSYGSTNTKEGNKKRNKKIKKEADFDLIQLTMEEKITYTDVTFSISLISFLHESILSSHLHKEN